jgi:hypothetical protein
LNPLALSAGFGVAGVVAWVKNAVMARKTDRVRSTHDGKILRIRVLILGISTAMLLASSCSLPKSASAIPVFANGQGGVNCGLCHTAVPNLNSYGRYVLMTNFSRGLNEHRQMMQNRSLPLALELTGNASNPPGPILPGVSTAIVQFLSGGMVGPHVSYFASVPLVTGGFPANSVDQVWAAYNRLSHGNGESCSAVHGPEVHGPEVHAATEE